MVAGISVLFRSTGFIVLTGLFFTYLIAALILKFAGRRAEDGYEDDSGFHFGSPESPVKTGSRPARPSQLPGELSCPQGELQKIDGGRRHSCRHRTTLKKSAEVSGGKAKHLVCIDRRGRHD